MSNYTGRLKILSGTAEATQPIRKRDAATTILLYIPAGTTGFLVPMASNATGLLSDATGAVVSHVYDAAGNVITYDLSALTLPAWIELDPCLFAAQEIVITTKTTALPSTWAVSNQAADRELLFQGMAR
jgi:hypothetical protein